MDKVISSTIDVSKIDPQSAKLVGTVSISIIETQLLDQGQDQD